MSDKLFEVLSLVNVEASPQVAAHHDSSESQVSNLVDIVERDAAEGIYPAVDESLLRCSLQLVDGKRLSVSRIGVTVEDRLQEDIVGAFLRFTQLTDICAGDGDIAAIAVGQLRVGRFEVNTA